MFVNPVLWLFYQINEDWGKRTREGSIVCINIPYILLLFSPIEFNFAKAHEIANLHTGLFESFSDAHLFERNL